MSGQPIDDLEHLIEETRIALARTLRDLEFRLSPRDQAGVIWRVAKERTAGSVRGTARWVSANPGRAAVVAMGIAGLAYIVVRGRRDIPRMISLSRKTPP